MIKNNKILTPKLNRESVNSINDKNGHKSPFMAPELEIFGDEVWAIEV